MPCSRARAPSAVASTANRSGPGSSPLLSPILWPPALCQAYRKRPMSREALLSPPVISAVPLWRLLFLGAGAAQDGREGFRGAKENTGQRQTGAGGLLRG